MVQGVAHSRCKWGKLRMATETCQYESIDGKDNEYGEKDADGASE